MQGNPPIPTPAISSQVKQGQAGPKEKKEKSNKQTATPDVPSIDKPAPKMEAKGVETQAEQHNSETPSEWRGTNAVIAFFTAILAGLALLQWLAMRDQAKHMRDTLAAVKQQGDAMMAGGRSWLLIDNETISDFQPLTGTYSGYAGSYPINAVRFKFKNYGPSPAWIVAGPFKLFRSYHDVLSSPIDYGEWEPISGGLPLPPGEHTHILEVVLEPSNILTADDVKDVMSGKLFIHLYGFIDYRDVFGKEHTSRFHLRYKPYKGFAQVDTGEGNRYT